jgi:hypothetical protein
MMSRIARALVVALLISAAMTSSGCIHTWTETYAEFPPEALGDKPHMHVQGDPSDG